MSNKPLNMLLFVALIFAALVPAHAQVTKIAFRNSGRPAGYNQYNPDTASEGVQLATTADTTLPKQFRSHAKATGGFTYTHPVPAGKYRLIFGFAEFEDDACVKGKRVFTISVNGRKTRPIDVFDAVGCNAPHFVRVRGVNVGEEGLEIKVDPVSDFPPFLATIKARQVSPAAQSPQALPSVSPGESPAASAAASADPSAAASPDPSASAAGASPEPSADPSPAASPSGTGASTGGGDPVDGTKVATIDVGGGSDKGSAVTGSTRVFSNVFPIEGTDDNAKFSKHRYGVDFTYTLAVTPGVTYAVNLFFSEAYQGACKDGGRIFDVSVSDADAPAAAKKITNLDVYATAGCRAAYTASLDDIAVGESGMIALNFKASKNNAMVSGFDIVTNDPNYTSAPSPSAVIEPNTDSVELNVGTNDTPPRGTRRSATRQDVSGTANVPGPYYKTARYGSDFVYKFKLAPGAYDIVLGFSEFFSPRFCSEPGKRVFNVYVNDQIQLEGFDVFEATGCFSGIEMKLPRMSVGAVDTAPLTIKFVSIVNLAQVSFISVKPAKDECVPASVTGGLADGEDHAAHAVPGSYPPQLNANSPTSYVDSDGNGLVRVVINGDGSHSHFFDAANNIIGVITSYTWSIVETGEVLSTEEKFAYNFPLGTTRLKLSVIDNSCTTDEAETTVTVTAAIQPGTYCYYYGSVPEPVLGGTLMSNPRPQFAAVSDSLNLGFPTFSFSETLFTARCFFFLEVTTSLPTATISVDTGGAGVARIYKGEDLILDTDGPTSAESALPAGLNGFEIIYERTTLASAAKFAFKVNGAVPDVSKVTYDRRTVVPVLTSVSPAEGPDSGGTKVKISGYGLFNPVEVKFGGQSVVVGDDSTATNLFVESPPKQSASVVDIVATSGAGLSSNAVSFAYGSTCDSIKFEETALTTSQGGPVNYLELPTCATIGQDGKIYMGTLGATVQVIAYDAEKLEVTSHCYSKSFVDNDYKLDGTASPRDILGIAFDPKDKVIRPYVSSSTLFWHDKNRVDRSNMGAWRNGAIDRLTPGTDASDDGVCLVYDKRIVSGLPVSNHDHSVNGLLFAQNGNLLVAVGGNTNMGLPGYKLGNFWETVLSGAILEVELTKAGFDGDIKYSNELTPRLAKKTSGDVSVYCTGLRNTFAMTMTGTGDIYASDQGPNCSFGDTASGCEDYDEAAAAAYETYDDVNWPGRVEHGWKSCPATSISRPDKMVHITKGKFYGHPNVQRGGEECAWIDPFDHLTADDKAAPAGYKKPLVTLKSSITGMQEYRSQHFCGKLRGELVLSTYKGGTTYRMGVAGDAVTSGPDAIAATGGITFVENQHGDLLFPRLTQKSVVVLRPKTAAAGVFVANAVPFRHGKGGGTAMVLGGRGFGAMATVTVGGSACAVTRQSDSEIACTLPPGAGLQDVVVTAAAGAATLPDGVLYSA